MSDEISLKMQEYTKILKREKELALEKIFCEDSDDPIPITDGAKDNVHKAAMECLDKILTPELKVFVKNLCFNRLSYPDEPIFYRMFGDYPEVGDKVSKSELVEKGVDLQEIDRLYDTWFSEGTWIEKEEIEGEIFYVIHDLQESA